MKSLGLNGVGGARFYVTLLVFTCTTILICAWGRTSLVARFLPQQLQGVVVPSEVRSGVPLADRNPLEFLPSEKGSGSSHVPEAEGGVAPAGPARTGEDEEDADTGLPDPSREDCNYAKGKWVFDEKRPLYSGFECKQWLSLMWACRLTPRTDFSFEAFKWKPNDCNMPDFKGPTFLKRMKNKTIAFVGDSLGRQQFQSLMCMATGGKMDLEVKDVGIEYGLVKAPGALRPDGWVYRFPRTNTTVLYYWSASLCELEPLDISNATTSIAMHLDRPATFLKKYISRFDVLVLNTGHHWNKGKLKGNRWEMYANGAPIKDPNLALIENAKNLTIYTVAKWVDSQLSQYPRLKAFFRTISPRHFINGDWNTGGGCNNTIPLLFGSQVSQNGSSDLVVEGALRGTRVKILDITALSQLRDEGHISKYSHKGITAMQDCLHWCLPGIPDSWNEILFAQL